MGRYYGSEALRDPKLPKKAIDDALSKLNPVIQNVGSQAMNQLSTKKRSKKNYKTNRKDIDGVSLREGLNLVKKSNKCGSINIRNTNSSNQTDIQRLLFWRYCSRSF